MSNTIQRRAPIRWTPLAYRLGRVAREVATVLAIGAGLGIVVLSAWIAS